MVGSNVTANRFMAAFLYLALSFPILTLAVNLLLDMKLGVSIVQRLNLIEILALIFFGVIQGGVVGAIWLLVVGYPVYFISRLKVLPRMGLVLTGAGITIVISVAGTKISDFVSTTSLVNEGVTLSFVIIIAGLIGLLGSAGLVSGK